MSPEQARLVAVVLVALTALLVGFQGASTLLTVTQLGASTPKATSAPRSHASLVPQAPVPVIKPAEPKAAEPAAAPTITAGEEAPSAGGPTPVPGEQAAAQVVADNQSGTAAAAKAKAQAEMDAMGPMPDETALPQEPRRRYRAPRPELHKVY